MEKFPSPSSFEVAALDPSLTGNTAGVDNDGSILPVVAEVPIKITLSGPAETKLIPELSEDRPFTKLPSKQLLDKDMEPKIPYLDIMSIVSDFAKVRTIPREPEYIFEGYISEQYRFIEEPPAFIESSPSNARGITQFMLSKYGTREPLKEYSTRNTNDFLEAYNLTKLREAENYYGQRPDRIRSRLDSNYENIGSYNKLRRSYAGMIAGVLALKEAVAVKRWPEAAVKAHKFRAGRLRLAPMQAFITELQASPAHMAIVHAFSKRKAGMIAGTQTKNETHRILTPFIAGVMNQPEMRAKFMGAIDASAAEESDNLKAEAREDNLQTELLIVGTGVHGSIFAAQYRADYPDSRIISADNGERLGGQFRSYGDRPVFRINSRNSRPQKNNVQALPGNDNNLNSFGDMAPFQLTDHTQEAYPTNKEMGETVAINQFLSAESLLQASYVSYEDLGDEAGYLVTFADKSSGELFSVKTEKLVFATGPGEFKKSDDQASVMTADEVFRHFGDASNQFPMDEFAGKIVGIEGGGDTGRVIAELMTWLAPKEAYGMSSVQNGGPATIKWLGTEFSNRDEFCNTNRSRYQNLAPFMGRYRGTSGATPIEAQPAKIERTYTTMYDQVAAVLNTGGTELVDVLIKASGLAATTAESLQDTKIGAERRLITLLPGSVARKDSNMADVIGVAKQIDRNVFIVGTAAGLDLSRIERATFADGIKENTLAIWANQRRTVLAASKIGSLN